MFPSTSPQETFNLRVSGKLNSLFPLEPIIKCLLFGTEISWMIKQYYTSRQSVVISWKCNIPCLQIYYSDMTVFDNFFSRQKGDRPLDDIIAEHASKLQKKSLLFSASNTKLSSVQKVSRFLKKIWFYQLDWWCELATVKRFGSWCFEC